MDIKLQILLTIAVIFMTGLIIPSRSHPHKQRRSTDALPRVHRTKRSPISIETLEPENNELTPDAQDQEQDQQSNFQAGNKKSESSWLNLEEIPARRIPVQLHSDVTIECIAVGSPAPQVLWLKNGIPLELEQSSNSNEKVTTMRFRKEGFVLSKLRSKLVLQCISPEDEAQYTCIAHNENGQVLAKTEVIIEENGPSHEIRAECEYKLPTIFPSSGTKAYISATESMRMQNLGGDVTLPCRAEGHPRPKISWIDNHGQPIVTGEKFEINSNGNLLIRRLRWSDMGEFSCIADNSFGSDLARTFVYPLMMD